MNIVKRKTIELCAQNYPEAAQSLYTWYRDVKKVIWNNPEDIKKKYPKASIIGNNRVVFNIGGNRYRLIVKVKYGFDDVFVVFFGTHQEYDKIQATTINIFSTS